LRALKLVGMFEQPYVLVDVFDTRADVVGDGGELVRQSRTLANDLEKISVSGSRQLPDTESPKPGHAHVGFRRYPEHKLCGQLKHHCVVEEN
jgi:hypothetical protein